MQNKIKKLEYYGGSPDGQVWIEHPNLNDIIDKINELIDLLNKEATYNAE